MKKYLYVFITLFLLVGITTQAATPASKSNTAKKEVKTTETKKVVPEPSINNEATNFLAKANDFREKMYNTIIINKTETQKRIDYLNNLSVDDYTKVVDNKKLLDATEKQIAYIKLSLLTISAFIFGSKEVFYGVNILVAFIVLRFLFLKIKNR